MKTKLMLMKKLPCKIKSSLLLAMLAVAHASFGQNTPPEKTPFVLDVNTVLVIMVGLLLFVIVVLAFTLVASIELFRKQSKEKKRNGQAIKSVLLFLVGMTSLQAIAQDASSATEVAKSIFSDEKIFRFLLWGILGLEMITIFGLVYWIRFFTGIQDLTKERSAERKKVAKTAPSWWIKANKMRPIEDEAELDVGHEYDGIRELDNVTPPWFTLAFVSSIIFGLGYLWNYHVAKASPNQYEEYEQAVTKANLQKEAYLKLKGDAVNENTVVMLDAAGIGVGKELFANNCVACHGKAGEGGVGPNLTDDYWLHGGKIGDIFKVIKLGVVEKGMMSWKDIFSADQIAGLASYIKSIHNTNPAGAKEKQGELYKEEVAKADSSSTAATTTNATKN